MDKPYFLAALPQLDDETFSNGVILVTNHNDEGAFGLLLNKPFMGSGEMPTQLVAEIQDQQGATLMEFEEPLFGGGPVREETLFALHECAELGPRCTQVAEGIWLATEVEVFQDLMTQEYRDHRHVFFLGCTSWEGGQLESELRTGTWLTVPFEATFLFRKHDPEVADWSAVFWREILKHGGCDPLTLIGQGPDDMGPN